MTRNRWISVSTTLVALFTIVLIGCGNTNDAKSGKSQVTAQEADASTVVQTKNESAEAPAEKLDEPIKTNTKPVKPTFKVKEEGLYAEMQTTKGNILLELEMEKTPMTVMNFVGLAEGKLKNTAKPAGEPFYDGLKFHRVIADFMIQGGDPQGTGAGSPGYKFADEVTPELTHSGPGILSMANSGPHTNGSQFFITHKETPWLDNVHTVFGHVVEGMDVVNAIAQNDKINHVIIIRKGKDAKDFEVTQEKFDQMKSGAQERLKESFRAYASKVAGDKCAGHEVKTTPEGLSYCITSKGSGPKANRGQKITAKYKGTFPDGKLFDQGEYSFELETGSVIQGWHVGFRELNQGDKATLVVPYWLGYGERAQRGLPGRATLIFEVELMSIQ